MQSVLLLVGVFVLSVIATYLVKKAAIYFKILDYPSDAAGRKIHTHPIPLLGGLAIATAFFIGIGLIYLFSPQFLAQISPGQFGAIFLASIILMAGGYLDDKYNLSPFRQFFFPLLAVLLVVGVGVNLKEITNPFGGTIDLQTVSWWGRFLLVDLVVFCWLLGMMYTTKLLDGLDGLVAGLTVIGSSIVGFLSLTEKFYQPDIALVSFIFAAANLGFLIFNFHPAKIFLGEGGSLFTGFMLGILSIAAGGKIATALLVMGVAIVDLAAVVVRRLAKIGSPFKGDAAHLHYRLLKAGLTQRQTVVIFYCLAIFFGLLTLFLQSKTKLLALLLLFILAVVLGVLVDFKTKTYGSK